MLCAQLQLSIGKKADEYKVDSSIEVRFRCHILFQIEECSEAESMVRLHDRLLNGSGHVSSIACICHVQVSVFICFV